MIIAFFFVIHWYTSLFFQSIFHHRYAAHGLFKMSGAWEKVFYIGCYITQGSSYISARTYGIMHRLHHSHTDTKHDPHSPANSGNLLGMMWETRNTYLNIFKGKTTVEDKYKKDLPSWPAFEKISHNMLSRVLWAVGYTTFYLLFASSWWLFLLLPFTIALGSIQGASVNWWAHRFGYVNFKQRNTSKNILPVDLIFWGEAYHNNHHYQPGNANNASRWFEWDMGYAAMKLLHQARIIRLKTSNTS